jgi:hypothetical protein
MELITKRRRRTRKQPVYANTLEITTTGSSSWVVPAGVTSIKIEAWGAGGGGHEADLNGGGSGAYCRKERTSVPGETINYTVGTGGTGYPQDVPSDATDGGDTTVDSMTAGGGAGAASTVGGEGAGGTATGGDINYNGFPGEGGTGNGGDAPFGGNGGTNTSINGEQPGGGGGSSNTLSDGGDGGDGKIIFYY